MVLLIVEVVPKVVLYVNTPVCDAVPKFTFEMYDVFTAVTLARLKILNPSARSSRFICSVNRILFEIRRSVVVVYGRRLTFRRKGTPSTPPAPNSVFDGVLKLGGNVFGIDATIAYPDETTTIGDNCR